MTNEHQDIRGEIDGVRLGGGNMDEDEDNIGLILPCFLSTPLLNTNSANPNYP